MEVVFFEIKMRVYGRFRLLLGKLRYTVALSLFIKVNVHGIWESLYPQIYYTISSEID